MLLVSRHMAGKRNITGRLDRCTTVHQQANRLEMPRKNCGEKRSEASLAVRINLGPMREEQVHDLGAAGRRCMKKRGPTLYIAAIGIRSSLDKAVDLGSVAALHRSNQFGVVFGHGYEA
jgi:hypothetical protein